VHAKISSENLSNVELVQAGFLLGSETVRVAVVTSDERLLGFAITTTSFGLENGRIAELEDLYVVPAARRQDLAKRLIDDTARWAHDRGCHHFELVVAPNGRDVTHLHIYYRRQGFLDEGRQLLSRELR